MNLREKLYPILKSGYALICIFFPKRKTKIVFFSYPDASDNSWHLYRYMASNLSGYTFVWLCSKPETVRKKILDKNHRMNNKVFVFSRLSIVGFYHFLTAGNVFHTHGTYFFVTKSSGPRVINLWHGMPIKMIGILDGKEAAQVSYGDYSICTSEFYIDIIAQSFGLPKERVLPIGLPRNDVLVNSGEQLKLKIFQILNIPSEAKLIFWLPTYRVSDFGDVRQDSLSSSFLKEWDEEFLEELNAIASYLECFIVIKIHPMDHLNQCEHLDSYDAVKIIKSEAWQSLNLDLYEALSCSSALITDISSVLIDYISTGKPIALTERSKNDYSRTTLANIDDIFQACYQIRDEKDFKYFLENLDHIDIDQKKLKTFNSIDKNGCLANKAITDYFIFGQDAMTSKI